MLGYVAQEESSEQRTSSSFMLSIVTPLFNEEGNIQLLLDRLVKAIQPLTPEFEIVCVDDGSSDTTPAILDAAAQKNPHIKVIQLSRNFGHQTAITAGMEFSMGNAIVIMDSDLQDPPELLPSLVRKWREGFDVVYAVRKKRKGVSWVKRLGYIFFYRLLRGLTKFNIPLDTGDFRLMDRRVVQAFLALPERQRFVRGMIAWVGFKQTGVEFERDPRFGGKAKYTIPRLIRLALDGITSFSYVPLQLAGYLGFFCASLSFLLILISLYAKLFAKPHIVEGWTSTFVMGLFIGGIQLCMIGLLGEYVGRTQDEVKKRPVYIVQRLVNVKKNPATDE